MNYIDTNDVENISNVCNLSFQVSLNYNLNVKKQDAYQGYCYEPQRPNTENYNYDTVKPHSHQLISVDDRTFLRDEFNKIGIDDDLIWQCLVDIENELSGKCLLLFDFDDLSNKSNETYEEKSNVNDDHFDEPNVTKNHDLMEENGLGLDPKLIDKLKNTLIHSETDDFPHESLGTKGINFHGSTSNIVHGEQEFEIGGGCKCLMVFDCVSLF
ncbi:hypothetical protein RF11_11182 [Thelohanellus kitauei]|uniref:Uncharacterized protein n=1 Tax=Thelohanellus kitauei TaxID=669202 RepID=A0A0C2MSE5_THEKT|nr:hypothetical protein RF11_11182 [Thelohanellus kitauei]